MAIFSRLQTALSKGVSLLSGQMTLKEFICFFSDRLFSMDAMRYPAAKALRMSDKGVIPIVKGSDAYHIKDARLPLLEPALERSLNGGGWEDSFWSYVVCDDKYDEDTFDKCDKLLVDGLYGLVNDKVNVTVKPGDIVIDAGSWIGDFAAYASVKGAAVTYAFEPVADLFRYLVKTAELNKNIVAVNKGMSDKNTSQNIFVDPAHFARSSFIEGRVKSSTPAAQVETVRLDDFVRENNLPRVDFIKADIEGFERHMLTGAQETLARFAPKLALCTYHLPDDPQVMASLILKANPRYNIVQKRKKLFASVPQ